jgi:hypothetical protein
MNFTGNDETEHTPVVRRATEVERAPVEAPAPKNRLRFNIPYLGEGEAEGPFGITGLVTVLMILALIAAVLARAL